VRAQFPNSGETKTIEGGAGRITDPVKRLRFLRTQMSEVSPPPFVLSASPSPKKLRHRFGGLRQFAWLMLPVMMGFATGPAPNGTAETFALERRLLVPSADPGVTAIAPVPHVWRVERSETTEVYSNGLRIDLTFVTPNRPRARYPIYSLAGASSPAKYGTAPIGIVFHTTESLVAPFEEDENRRLKQLSRNLLEVIRQKRAYHYLIDRFGRVFAVVAESDAADHVGNSVWADADGIYVNLNDSFLGVSFEGQTGATDEVTPAQIQSARVLTEALRSRYGIAAENCVTHAQVSVNPLNMRIGAHTDWGSKFPFTALGLPNNYAVPLASVYAFGFDYDGAYVQATGMGLSGLALAVEQVEKQAAGERVPVAQYRAMLQHRYKDITAALQEQHKEQSEGGN